MHTSLGGGRCGCWGGVCVGGLVGLFVYLCVSICAPVLCVSEPGLAGLFVYLCVSICAPVLFVSERVLVGVLV